MAKKTIKDIDVEGRKVLLRVDFNVPLDTKTNAITDDNRIRASLLTIKYLVDHKAKVILCSHLGRPKGKVVEELRIAPVAQRLSKLIGRPVAITRDCIGIEVEKAIDKLKEGELLFLENLRFHPGEEANDPFFAQKLAKLADIYVNDAFGTAHRTHASTVGIAKRLPAVAGFLMEKELEVIGGALSNPERPFASLVGGAKVSDKIGLLQNILDKVDSLLIGGSMAATFLKAKGYEVGHSQIEEDKLNLAKQLLDKARNKGVSLLLPVDVIVTGGIEAQTQGKVVPINKIPANSYIADVGPQTIELFSQELKKCRTVIWNGPLGIYEKPHFAKGTRSMAELLSTLKTTTVIGGGSSAEVVQEMGLTDKMTHVSTGGGASLRFMEGETLPGVAILLDK